MAKTYNGRFDSPKPPKRGVGWLIAGIALIAIRPLGTVLSIIGAVACFSAFGKQDKDSKLVERFHQYCGVIGMRERVPVREFTKVDQRPIADVRRDLNQMIAKGYFGSEAYLDLEAGCLVVATPETERKSGGKNWADVASELLETLRNGTAAATRPGAAKTSAPADKHDKQERAEAERPAPNPEPKPEPKPEPAAKPAQPQPGQRNYADELERTLNELYQLNVMIEDEAVSARIDRIGMLTADIFHAVIQRPEREADVRKFMNYYLPTTLKLLKSYDMLEDQSYQSESIIESRKKIEGVLDTLIQAYEKQLENLFMDDALDIATDIDVLETMMAGDGLTGGMQMPNQ